MFLVSTPSKTHQHNTPQTQAQQPQNTVQQSTPQQQTAQQNQNTQQQQKSNPHKIVEKQLTPPTTIPHNNSFFNTQAMLTVSGQLEAEIYACAMSR